MEETSLFRPYDPTSETILFFESALETLARCDLRTKQLQLLEQLTKFEGLLYYQTVQKLSSELNLPPSTVRWSLDKLRATNLIVSGHRHRKGVPVRITVMGRIVLRAFQNMKLRREKNSELPGRE